jgi:hypothetical protein
VSAESRGEVKGTNSSTIVEEVYGLVINVLEAAKIRDA